MSMLSDDPFVSFAVMMFFLSYLVGSVPFGWLIGWAAGIDIRKHGSGNIGATNVWRLCGWRWGLPAFILDALKGAMPVIMASAWAGAYGVAADTGVSPFDDSKDMTFAFTLLEVGCAIMAVVGHNFPVWLRFRGGKGVATSAGAMLALAPWPCLVAIATFVILVAWKRYISLGSIGAALMLGVATTIHARDGWPRTAPLVACAWGLAVLLIARHRHNITRLLEGTESRFSLRGAPAPTPEPAEAEPDPEPAQPDKENHDE